MSVRKIVIYVTVVFSAFLTVCLLFKESEYSIEIIASISCDQGEELVKCWENQEGDVYVFLPSYADISQARIDLQTETPMQINGISLEDGMSCDMFLLNTPYELKYSRWGRTYNQQLMFVQSSDVATMHIDTQSGSMDYIHAEKGNEEAGTIRLYTAEGAIDYQGELEAINGRGNATWSDFDKKPYSLKLKGEADLLHMGAAQKWILLANASDPSNMRNKIVYDFADKIGLQYSPDSQWVDLFLNGEYAGLYLLCERNEVHSERVEIASEGSFLVSAEIESRLIDQNREYVLTNAKQALRIHFKASSVDVAGILQSVENALLSDDGIDILTGKSWLELIDLDSWTRKVVLEELFGNLDACFISQYYYLDGGDGQQKVYAGPIWDFDNAIGNRETWQIMEPTVQLTNRSDIGTLWGVSYSTPWISSMYAKEEFCESVYSVFREIYPEVLMLLEDALFEYSESIEDAAAINQIRWGIEQDVWSETEYMSVYLTKRIKFLASFWGGTKKYYQVRVNPVNGHYACYTVMSGECLPSVPQLEDENGSSFLGWYYVATDEPFDPTAPIYEDIEIYAKWEDSGTKNIKQIIKLLPLAAIALLGVCLLGIEIRRNRKGR